MNQFKKLLVLLPAFALILGLTASPVLARDGSDDSSSQTTTTASTSTETSNNSTSTTTQSETSGSTETSETENKTQVEKETKPETKDVAENEIETESKDLISELKKTEKEHTQTERQQNCTAAEKGLETKLGSLSKNASAFQVRIDKVLTMAVAYQKDNNLSIDNFSALVATAQAAQTKSASSISALSALNPNLDCSQASVAQNVAEFKVATAQVRTNLKAYKEAVKAVLTAIETAKGGN